MYREVKRYDDICIIVNHDFAKPIRPEAVYSTLPAATSVQHCVSNVESACTVMCTALTCIEVLQCPSLDLVLG